MKNNLISIVLCATLCINSTVFAAVTTVADNKREVTVSEKVTPEASGTLIVVKAGESVDNDEMIYAVKYATADKDGVIIWNFTMPDTDGMGNLTDGEYDLYIKENGKTIKKDKMIYASVKSRDYIKTSFSMVESEKDVMDILEKADNLYALKILGFSMDEYISDSANKRKVAELTYNGIKNIELLNIDDYSKIFNLALTVDGISADTAQKYLSIVNLEFDNIAYNDIKDEKQKEWIKTQIVNENYTTIESFVNKYESVNVFFEINNSRIQHIEEKLTKYGDVLGIGENETYKKYISLKNKDSVNEKIVELLDETPAENVDKLLMIIKKAIPATKPQNVGGGGSSSGGGGGGTASYPDIKNNNSSLGGVAVSTPVSETVLEKKLSDLDDAPWAADIILKLADDGIISGDDNNRFNPNKEMTREEFVTMLVRATDLYNEDAESDFIDVDKNAWYYKYVSSANASGIVYGVGENRFGIGTKLSRQDMTVISKRVFDRNRTLDKKRELNVFADDKDIADYAKDAVYELYAAEIINGVGDNRFAPLGTATKAQGAVLIYNLFFK